MIRKCYSVRLKSLKSISDKAYRAEGFDGKTDIIPKSQVVGYDLDVYKSDAYWITEWILEKTDITYSEKKCAYFDEHGIRANEMKIVRHVPENMETVTNNIKSLER